MISFLYLFHKSITSYRSKIHLLKSLWFLYWAAITERWTMGSRSTFLKQWDLISHFITTVKVWSAQSSPWVDLLGLYREWLCELWTSPMGNMSNYTLQNTNPLCEKCLTHFAASEQHFETMERWTDWLRSHYLAGQRYIFSQNTQLNFALQHNVPLLSLIQ